MGTELCPVADAWPQSCHSLSTGPGSMLSILALYSHGSACFPVLPKRVLAVSLAAAATQEVSLC